MRGGNTIELAGEPATGKTLVSLKLIVAAQKLGGVGFFIDVEGRLGFSFAQSLGVDLDSLYYYQPTKVAMIDGVEAKVNLTQPDVFKIVREILTMMDLPENRDIPFVIVLDSLGALLTDRDIGLEETSTDKYKVSNDGAPKGDQGMRAKNLRAWIVAISPHIQTSQGLFVLLNHLWSNTSGYGVTTDTRGGRAPKYLASARIFFSKSPVATRLTDKNSEVVGEVIRAYVEKNSVGPPYRETELLVTFREEGGVSLDYYNGLTSYLVKHGLITQAGAWFRLPNTDLKWQGKANLEADLRDGKLVFVDGKLKEGNTDGS
jgi:recombination protein RecA